MTATHLVDKSALARYTSATVAHRLDDLKERGSLATCTIVDMEVLYSARSSAEYRAARQDRVLAYVRVSIDQPVLDRAELVQGLLADRGQHRAAAIPDLMIAAAAEAHGLTVLHYDADYDLIAEITGQPVEWVVERGSVP